MSDRGIEGFASHDGQSGAVCLTCGALLENEYADCDCGRDEDTKEARRFEVVDCGWLESRLSPHLEVRHVETGEIVYETDNRESADVMCDRFNAEGLP